MYFMKEDIILYLVLIEWQIRQLSTPEYAWQDNLLRLFTSEITETIAWNNCELKEKINNYENAMKLLLKCLLFSKSELHSVHLSLLRNCFYFVHLSLLRNYFYFVLGKNGFGFWLIEYLKRFFLIWVWFLFILSPLFLKLLYLFKNI